jgi:hypothetical protein
LFFSYGHVYELITGAAIGGFVIGRHRYLLIVYFLILAGAILWVMRTKSSLKQWSSALVTIAVVLLVFPVYQLIAYQFKAGPPERTTSAGTNAPSTDELPDVYYIILDTYGRTDVLREYAGYDNSPFIQSLRDLGFYVAACSQSNYAHTGFSLASSLNLNYLDQLEVNFAEGSKREDVVAPYIKHSAVVDRMRDLGYRVIAFETGYDFTTLDDTDILYPASQKGITDFELILLRSTALVYLDDTGRFKGLYPTPDENRRGTILSQLETLKSLPTVAGPKFVFAHLMIPHFPHIFGPDGESLIGTDLAQSEGDLTTKEYFQGYRGQTIFTSNQILDVVSEIIQNSDTPPIIILQGDHGPSHAGEAARMGILNAYYFPGRQTAALYPDITPVNSFRVVFNTFFDDQLDLLPDVSIFSRKNSPEEITVIPNECVPY